VIFTELSVSGVFEIRPEPFTDERGAFARTFCAEEFASHGLETYVSQCSTSYNAAAATLRGMHLQVPPRAETKLIRCVRGAIFDVAVDLRPESADLGAWVARELTAANGISLYLPHGVAHGFLTLVGETQVDYVISTPYAPDAAAGVRWDDPAFGIAWPMEPRVISERDRTIADVDLGRVRREGLQVLQGSSART
jgi:dTDP-4-dehydrorhamnose 3,5-epimerase